MSEKHIEYDLYIRVNICTKLDKRTILNRLDDYIEAMPECFMCVKDYRFENIKLCDCSALEDKLQEQAESEE